jgi:hypothetical protein
VVRHSPDGVALVDRDAATKESPVHIDISDDVVGTAPSRRPWRIATPLASAKARGASRWRIGQQMAPPIKAEVRRGLDWLVPRTNTSSDGHATPGEMPAAPYQGR